MLSRIVVRAIVSHVLDDLVIDRTLIHLLALISHFRFLLVQIVEILRMVQHLVRMVVHGSCHVSGPALLAHLLDWISVIQLRLALIEFLFQLLD